MRKIKLQYPKGATIQLAPDKHNSLQLAVIEEFGPRFAPGASLLYLHDQAEEYAICDAHDLGRLGFGDSEITALPDIMLFDAERNWLFLIEAVTSHGAVTAKRRAELESMLVECSDWRVYVTACRDQADFQNCLTDVGWETTVWIAETPDHMIHLDARRPEPYKRSSERDPQFLASLAEARRQVREGQTMSHEALKNELGLT